MKRSHVILPLLVAALIAASAPALAQKKETVRLDRVAMVGSTLLEPGTYRLELAPSFETVTLYSGARAVATSRCKVGTAEGRLYGNAVHFVPGGDGHEIVTKLVFSGSRLSIDVLPPAADESPIAQADGR